jgi:hypothetical protein
LLCPHRIDPPSEESRQAKGRRVVAARAQHRWIL